MTHKFHGKDRDQFLDRNGNYEVSAEDLKEGLNNIEILKENSDISDIFLSPKLNTKPLTKDIKYERNPFLFKDSSGKYWLAYVRCTTLDSRTDGDVDSALYEVYYKTSIDGIIWTAPVKFSGVFDSSFSPREICVVEDNTGDVHLFIGNGVSGSPSDKRWLYHSKTTDSGSSWSTPVAITITGWSSDPAQIGHMHVQYANSNFYLTFQQRSNMSVYFAKSANPELFGSYTTIHAATYGLPKIFVEGTDVYIVSVKWSGPTCNLAISNNDGVNWANADLPYGGYDPAITRLLNGNLGVVIAPGFGADGQKLQLFESTDNGASWGSLQDLTPNGLRETDEYWDYWPNFFRENNTDYIVYTSEDDLFGRAKQPGNIYLLKLNAYTTKDTLIKNTSSITGTTVKDALDNLIEKNGINGTFTTTDGKTVTVVDGQITNIV